MSNSVPKKCNLLAMEKIPLGEERIRLLLSQGGVRLVPVPKFASRKIFTNLLRAVLGFKAHFGPHPDRCQWYTLKIGSFGMRTSSRPEIRFAKDFIKIWFGPSLILKVISVRIPIGVSGIRQKTGVSRCERTRLEWIHSNSTSSPEGFWYDQEEGEWVLLLKGSGLLEYSTGRLQRLMPGEAVYLPPRTCHRVKATEPQTLCLALFLPGEPLP